MGAAASIAGEIVSGDTEDDIVAEVAKRCRAGIVDNFESDECESTLLEDGIP